MDSPRSSEPRSEPEDHINLIRQEDQQLDLVFRKFITSEDFGTECADIVRKSSEDQRATDIISEGTKHLTPGFEIPLPWKEGEPNLRNNRSHAIQKVQ